MEKEKRGVSVFTVLSIIVIVAVIVALVIVIYLNVQKSDRIVELETQLSSSNEATIDNNSSADVQDTENLNEAREILTTDRIKGKYNALLYYDTKYVQVMISDKRDYSAGTYNSGEFSNDEMLTLTLQTISYDEMISKAREDSSGARSVYYLSKDYVNECARKLFGKDIDYSNVSILTTDTEVAWTGIDGLGVAIYKAKSLVLNEKTGVYTLTIDSLDANVIDSITEYVSSSKTSYTSDEIAETFVLTYTKDNEDYTLLTLERTYVKDGYVG